MSPLPAKVVRVNKKGRFSNEEKGQSAGDKKLKRERRAGRGYAKATRIPKGKAIIEKIL